MRIEGFTTLVGRSNLGKSAIVRAIKAALTGAPEDDDVRHGPTCERETKGTKGCKCYCTVHLKSDGFDLLWEKGGGKNEYTLNGTKYTAVNKGTPDFLEDSFGLVKIGDRKLLLQVADQFRHEGGGPIFLLDEAGSVVADVLSDVAQLDRINVASRLAEKDRRDCGAQRKVREKDVIDLKVKIVGYDGLDDVLVRVREVEAEERRVTEQRQRRDQLGAFKEAVGVVGRQYKALSEVTKVLVPDMAPLQTEYSKAKALHGFLQETETRQAIITNLQGVDAVTVAPFEVVKDVWGKFGKLSGWVTRLRSYKDLFGRWKTLEVVPTPEIGGLPALSERGIKLAHLHGRATTLAEAVSKLERACEAVETEFIAVETEKNELGVCPTCAQPVAATHEHAAE